MAGHRHAGTVWNLREEGGGSKKNVYGYGTIHSAILMDIRDELQKLNALLGCRNFIGIPATLRGIRANTEKPKRKRKPGV